LKDLPPAKTRENGWMIGKPDLVIEMPGEANILASGRLDYMTCKTKVPWREDAFITAVEIVPGNRGVLHHAELYMDGFNAMVATFAPGSEPLILPPRRGSFLAPRTSSS
jgi:hypothetical protein